MSIRYVVRTLDRPDDLRDLLHYLERFVPELGLVVIDGSELEIQEQNKAEIARFADSLNIEFISIAPKTDILERTITGLEAISDDFVFFGADDDLPCIEFIEQANRLIAAGKVASTDKIFGDQVKLSLMSTEYVRVKKLSVPDAFDDDPMIRLRRLAQHYQPLVYGVFGRECLIEEYRMTHDVMMTGPGSYDFALGERFMGAIAVATGRLHYISGLSLIRSVKSSRHKSIDVAFWPTLFLPRADERAWNAVRHLARVIHGDLDTLDMQQKQVLVREVHDLAVGRRGRPDMSKNENWHIGDAALRQVFDGVSPEYLQFRDRLLFARDRILEAISKLAEQSGSSADLSDILASDENVAATLQKLDRINASAWGMILEFDNMTTVQSRLSEATSDQERPRRGKGRKALRAGRGLG